MRAIAPVVILSVLVIAYAAYKLGQFTQHAKNGYSVRVLSKKEFDAPFGKLILKDFHEHVGFGLLEPQTQTIAYEPSNASPLTLYRSQAGFQEMYPHVSTVEINDGAILWTDGIFDYRLVMTRVENRTDRQELKSSGW